MTVTFAEKLARIPGYQAGVPEGKAPEAIADSGIAQLASNESPFPPHPDVVEAISRAAAAMNRYPDPSASLLRRRIGERFELDGAADRGRQRLLRAAAGGRDRPLRARRRDRLRLAVVLDVPVPGAALGGARDPGAAERRRRARPRRDRRPRSPPRPRSRSSATPTTRPRPTSPPSGSAPSSSRFRATSP